MNDRPTVMIDGEETPVDDCIWLERHPCGCVASAAVAFVPDVWTLATADQAARHFSRTEGERRRALAAGLTVEPITGGRYRDEFQARWHCGTHSRPAATPA
ncbi:hypothetical protein [Streptomyces lancefieldiae]|uniref:Uncharacterized protein n=1 Tax=Streptomyces lancefieldiae TaxID=3075520 RepID=A0ABU3AGY3_9ACTN|nr:hypothetical protein [Streptomyces sp. DSM 40712]MDT0608807.1 hypothetical protein [Streptomyces sp. DSM 40712]